MTDEPQIPSPTRKGTTPIKVYCLPTEIASIQENARRTGLTASTYLRELGLGYAPASTVDLDCRDLLSKVNADQARLGNLLKLWLDDDVKLARFDPAQIRATILLAMDRIHECQAALLDAAQRLKRL